MLPFKIDFDFSFMMLHVFLHMMHLVVLLAVTFQSYYWKDGYKQQSQTNPSD